MAKPVYVTCPSCKKSYYVVAEDYLRNVDASCRCPFCVREFDFSEGKPTIEGKTLSLT